MGSITQDVTARDSSMKSGDGDVTLVSSRVSTGQDGKQTGKTAEIRTDGASVVTKDTKLFTGNLKGNASYEPSEVVFPRISFLFIGNDTGQEFDDLWKFYRDAENSQALVRNIEELRNKLLIGKDWNGFAQLKELISILDKKGLATEKNLTYIFKIARTHGYSTAERISGVLVNYYNSYSSPGTEQEGILQDALHDIAYPSDIAQGNKGTCSAAAVQMKLAIERPLQYIETLTTLAKNTNFKLPSGDYLKPNNTWRNDSSDDRSYSCKIMQNALMQLGGVGIIWDTSYNSTSEGRGLNWWEQTGVIEKVFDNSDYDNDSLLSSGSTLYQYVEDDIARGRTVTVSFKNHVVLVVGIDKTKTPPLVIMNSWGKQYSMTVDEFIQKVKAVRSLNDKGSDDWKIPAGRKIILGDTD